MEEKVLTQEEAQELSEAILLYLIYHTKGHFEVDIRDIYEWVGEKQPQASFITKNGILYIDVTSDVVQGA